MSVLDGFFLHWQTARETFGEGTPQTGEQFDRSAGFRELAARLESTAPGDQWSGAAADAYNAVSTEHRRVIGELANLDDRLGAQVTHSAQIVTAGRTNLETVRSAVAAIAARLPEGSSGDAMRYALVSQGTGQVNEIVRRSSSELSTVGANLRAIGEEYRALGVQKFGSVPKENPTQNLLGEYEDGEKNEEENQESPEEQRRTAEQDVQDALAGDREAAARVYDVLRWVTPGEELTAVEGSYLSQMQAQQHGMTIEELEAAHERLGGYGVIMAESWQLMSNDDVSFPESALIVGALDDPDKMITGGFDKLPDSVQHALNRDGLNSIAALWDPIGVRIDNANDVSVITDIMREGSPILHQGTHLDTGMLEWSQEALADPIQPIPTEHLGVGGSYAEYTGARDEALVNVFETAGRDHIAVGEFMISDRGDGFLHDVIRHEWPDDGLAAGTLFSWTGEHSQGPLADLAAETAHRYATHIGTYDSELLSLNNQTLGDINPELVQGMAEGLTPYIPNIVEAAEGKLPGFDLLDEPGAIENGMLPISKGVFSVISSDDLASELFNGAALHHAALAQERFAEDFVNGVADLTSQSAHLNDSATLQGLVDAGLHNALMHEKLNGIELEKAVYEAKSQAFDMKKAIAEGLGSALPKAAVVVGPGIDIFGQATKELIIGPPPTTAATDANGNYIAPDMPRSVANGQIIAALVNQGVDVSGVPAEWIVRDADGNSRILSYTEVTGSDRKITYGGYNEDLGRAAEAVLGQGFANDVANAITSRYNAVAQVLNPQADQPEQPR